MFKKLSTAYILSFVVSFMIWIYEPITMYANNIEDLWFNLDIIFFPLLIIFILTFITLCGVYTLIYLLNKKILKKYPIYKFVLISSFICFFATYIQGNYLIYNLPALDGAKINWSIYKIDSIISACLWLLIIVIAIIFLRKKGYNKVESAFKYITIAISLMLIVSLTSTILTTDVLNGNQESIEFTMDNFNDISTDKNFYIFLVDAVDSIMFEEVLNKSEYKDTFEDFSYFKDTMSTYGFTRDSIPFILSGIWNENKTNFTKYSNDALNKSPLFKKLNEKKYNINLYDMELVWNSKETKKIANTSDKKVHLNKSIFYRQEAKYFIYKYFPYFLKKFSYIETMDYIRCKYVSDSNLFDWKNSFTYENLQNNINKVDKKNFNYVHIEGAHVPFDMDENLNPIENGTYNQKLGATLKVINTFIKKLKDNKLYDNSVIIVLSDHGYNFNEYDGRQNPILFIKGIDEHHDMYYSDIPVSYEDLIDAYNELLDDKKSTELFSNVNKNRKRRYLWYKFTEENHMVEYEQSGKAWDEETLKPTGKEFNR